MLNNEDLGFLPQSCLSPFFLVYYQKRTYNEKVSFSGLFYVVKFWLTAVHIQPAFSNYTNRLLEHLEDRRPRKRLRESVYDFD